MVTATHRYLARAGTVPGLWIKTAPFFQEDLDGVIEEVDETEAGHVDASVPISLQLQLVDPLQHERLVIMMVQIPIIIVIIIIYSYYLSIIILFYACIST